MTKAYRLVPEEVPHIVRATVYDDILKDFLESKARSVRVEIPKKKPATIYMGLLKAKKGSDKYSSIAVSKREDRIYLVNK